MALRPATPGFIVTFVATILLAVVSFSTPLIKSVYFLKASLSVENIDGTVEFGTLGYCVTMSGLTTCSSATVGYEFNINALVGNNSSIQIPEVVVKWLTYALVLHIVAFALAGISAIFGLLAHVREMAMTCCSSCISGFGATVALVAFFFDIALFFVAKSRMNSVTGGSASMGNAVWLTLAAAILLFFSGCFYGIGRCCIRRRGKNMYNGRPGNAEDGFGNREQVRLDVVKAEADRKARQAQGETGLPAFQEYEQTQPLKAKVDGDEVYFDEAEAPYRDNHSVTTATGGRGPSQGGYAGGGYAPAPVGGRAIDEYNNNPSSYPPPPQRRVSTQTQFTASSYPSSYAPPSHTQTPTIPAVVAAVPTAATSSPVHESSPSNYYNQDPYGTQAYGHVAGGSSYARAEPSYYNPYDAQTQTHYADPSHNADPYNTGYNPYAATDTHQPERSYTLGGNGYGANTVPPLQASEPYYGHYQSPTHVMSQSTSPPPLLDTGVARASPSVSPVRGPRGPRTSIVLSPPPTEPYSDSPPDYESGPSGAPGQWGRKI